MQVAQFNEDRALSAHLARVTSNDSDAASVLDDLVRGGDLDEERVGDMIQEAARRRIGISQPTPNGKFVGIAVDACALLIDLQRCIERLNFFSAGDTGLGELQRTAERANAILQRMGYRNGNAGSAS